MARSAAGVFRINLFALTWSIHLSCMFQMEGSVMVRIMKARGVNRPVKSGTVREKILASSERFWRPNDLSGVPKTISNVLSELVREGELERVRRGLYWRGVKTPLGMSPPPEAALVSELLGTQRGVGPAGLSAASALRLSTQVPRFQQIAVPCRVPVGDFRVKFSGRNSSSGRAAANLTGLEVAFLEVLRDLSVSELDASSSRRRLDEVLTSDLVRPAKLAAAASTEPAAVRARLSAMLTDCGQESLSATIPIADPRVTKKALEGFRVRV
ncbi:hypothetical protein G9U53_26245 [Rhodococcus sp. D-46]|uniref:type IV toxin-antitoxin system AbiEi family antitoxin domain-containing protein n=1 Tax=Rhodococcus sp. D-46 TaxID=2716265 RepID=UPI0013F69305|nr:hypothetical protein [Rhodococcus sp. D-46]